jgi:hypothetical protein
MDYRLTRENIFNCFFVNLFFIKEKEVFMISTDMTWAPPVTF